MIYTYNDLLKVGVADEAKSDFCKKAIKSFKESPLYAESVAGEAYYNKHNTTIEHYQKTLRTISGMQVADVFSANYKLKTTFFRRLCTQQVQYLLGNGMNLQNMANKEKLGKDFDFQLQKAAKLAMACGRSFGFWNFDHIEVFGFSDSPSHAGFCPLYDEKTSDLMGGIRFWHKAVGKHNLLKFTLYEQDGFTTYSVKDNEKAVVIEPKRGYVQNVETVGKTVMTFNEPAKGFPIVQLFANDSQESELVGIRECIDCYDFVKSGLANDIDDMSGFYWILKNTGGMDDVDLAQFIQRMKTVRAAVVDGDDGATAEAHTQEIPVNARSTMLELLRKDIYEDFQALDVNTLSAAAKTTQEIQAAYQAMDNKVDDFEYFIIDFVEKIMALAGIDDTPSFVRSRIVNKQEETNMVLSASTFLSEEAIIKHLPFLTPEEVEEEINKRKGESFAQFHADDEEDETDEEETADDEDGEEVEE